MTTGAEGYYGDRYWATEPDTDLVINRLKEIRKEFHNQLQDSEFYKRIERSHQYYYGNYFGGMSFSDREIKVGGADDEFDLLAANEYRATLNLLKTYVTTLKADWDTLAIDSAANGLEATKLGNELLDGYMADNKLSLESRFRRAAEDGLVYSAGFIWNKWNDQVGDEIDANPITGKIIKSGGLEFLNPHLFDVTWDTSVDDFRDSKWVCVRNRENKWDIVEQYAATQDGGKPDRDEILANAGCRGDLNEEIVAPAGNEKNVLTEDTTWVYYFYHKPCASLPDGRFVKYIGDLVLDEDQLADGHIPVHRFCPAYLRGSCFGYTIAFDLQGSQEGLNVVYSTLMTAMNKLGLPKLWFKAGEPINLADLEPGIGVVQSEIEPKPISLLPSIQVQLTAIDNFRGSIERISGVNATSRGNPEHQLAGKAYEMLEDRTRQSASDMISNYFTFMTDVGNSILQIHKNRSKRGFNFTATSLKGPKLHRKMTPEILQSLDSVSVIVGNPLMSSWGSRAQTLNYLLGTQMISTKEEFVTVLLTGKLDVLLESNDKQLDLIHAENDEFINGGDVEIVADGDNHVLHIKKHQSVMDSPAIRRNTDLALRINAHILKHLEFLQDPNVQQWQMTLGYQLPLPPNTQQQQTGGPMSGGPQGTPRALLPGEGRNGPLPKGPMTPPVPEEGQPQ